MLPVECLEPLHVCADQHWRATLGELGGEDLFVAVAQALAAVYHKSPQAFRCFEDIRTIDVFVIERGVLAHQDHVELREVSILGLIKVKPMILITKDVQRGHAGARNTLLEIDVGLLHIE